MLQDRSRSRLILRREVIAFVAIQCMSAVACPSTPLLDHLRSHSLKVVGPADLGEKVDQEGGMAEGVATPLGRPIIPGEDVMIVVPALAKGHERNEGVLRGIHTTVWKKEIIKMSPFSDSPIAILTCRTAFHPTHGPCCSPSKSCSTGSTSGTWPPQNRSWPESHSNTTKELRWE